MKVLVIDIGGTHVKILASGHRARREFPSGPTLTAKRMVAGVKQLARGWRYDVLSIGYPGPVLRNRPIAEPRNLAAGCVRTRTPFLAASVFGRKPATRRRT
jgi:polyphosphate glucokinase